MFKSLWAMDVDKRFFRVETRAHHVLTGTYDKRIITGLDCSY